MTGFEAFSLYHALYLHFSTDSYNYVTYSGKTKTTVESFENRTDKYTFAKLGNKYNTQDLALLYIANMIDDLGFWAGDFLTEEAIENMVKHQKVLESMTYIFSDECKYIFGSVDNPNEVLLVKSGEYPVLLTQYLRSKVSLETLCILNKLLNFLPRWILEIKDTIQWPIIQRKIEKYSCFLPNNVVKYRQLLKEVISKP